MTHVFFRRIISTPHFSLPQLFLRVWQCNKRNLFYSRLFRPFLFDRFKNRCPSFLVWSNPPKKNSKKEFVTNYSRIVSNDYYRVQNKILVKFCFFSFCQIPTKRESAWREIKESVCVYQPYLFVPAFWLLFKSYFLISGFIYKVSSITFSLLRILHLFMENFTPLVMGSISFLSSSTGSNWI